MDVDHAKAAEIAFEQGKEHVRRFAFKKAIVALKRAAKLEIRTKTLAAMAEFPNDDGKLVPKIKPEDFERARDAVDKLQKDMATELAQIPPTHTPVSVLFDLGEEETKELNNG